MKNKVRQLSKTYNNHNHKNYMRRSKSRSRSKKKGKKKKGKKKKRKSPICLIKVGRISGCPSICFDLVDLLCYNILLFIIFILERNLMAQGEVCEYCGK